MTKRARVLKWPRPLPPLTREDLDSIDDAPKTECERAFREGFRAGLEWAAEGARLVEFARVLRTLAETPVRIAARQIRGRRMTRAREERAGRLGWLLKAFERDQQIRRGRRNLSERDRARIIGRELQLHPDTVRKGLRLLRKRLRLRS